MRQFPTAGDAASGAGICPGNHESAGKRRHVRTPKGNRWLRSTLVECARAAVRQRNCYLGAQYRRLAKRRGDRGRSSRSVIRSSSPPGTSFGTVWIIGSWGGQYFDRVQRERLVQY
jgi:transposase